MASLLPRLAPGATFAERFRILAYVGQGSMGSVYRAERLEGGPSVALKLVRLDTARDPRALRRFEREVESGLRIASPHVARTLDSGAESDGLAWLCLEFAEGLGLSEALREQGPLELSAATSLLEALFDAVAAAHAVGIVHRDLKPDNVRVAALGEHVQLKVLDFGVAKDFGVNTLSGTAPGLGSPLWTAPEQTRPGYQPSSQADVWSLGLLTFFVLTGSVYWKHAAERASMADLAIELIQGEEVPASQRARELGLNAALPPGFDAWFARSVHRDPGQRFAGAEPAWAALESLLGGLPSRAAAVESAGRQSLAVRPSLFLTLLILSCLMAGLTIYWLLRSMRI